MTQAALILHHYPSSPFAEKVRLMLGFKQLAWRSVLVSSVVSTFKCRPLCKVIGAQRKARSAAHAGAWARAATRRCVARTSANRQLGVDTTLSILPKPDVVALTGGYRRTPVLQIGADIYCDTALIGTVLEHLQPEPPLYPPPLKGVARILADWADHTLFWTAMAYNLQPRGAAVLFAKAPEGAAQAFAADRRAMGTGMQRQRVPEATAAYRSYLRRIAHMVEEHDFLFGAQPCAADFSVYHPLWFTRTCVPLLADIFDATPAVLEWMDRMAVLGHGHAEKISAHDAITVAAGAEPLPLEPCIFQDEHGIALGSPVTLTAQSFGTEPTHGELLAATRTHYTLRRHDPRAGTLHVHFPRMGYVLERADA